MRMMDCKRYANLLKSCSCTTSPRLIKASSRVKDFSEFRIIQDHRLSRESLKFITCLLCKLSRRSIRDLGIICITWDLRLETCSKCVYSICVWFGVYISKFMFTLEEMNQLNQRKIEIKRIKWGFVVCNALGIVWELILSWKIRLNFLIESKVNTLTDFIEVQSHLVDRMSLHFS